MWPWSAALIAASAGLLAATASADTGTEIDIETGVGVDITVDVDAPPGAAPGTGTGLLDAADRAVHEALSRAPWRVELADGLADFAGPLGYGVLWVPVVLVLAWFARWRALLVYVGTIFCVAALAQLAAGDAPLSRVVRAGVTGSADEFVVPAWPVVVLGAVGAASLYALAPAGRARRWGWAVVVILLVGQLTARAALGQGQTTASVLGAVAGASAAALAFTVLVPGSEFPVRYHRVVRAHLRLGEERTARVIAAVREQLGIELAGLAPYRLDGSAGSTPCRLRLAHGPPDHLFGKLYATSHLRSDRWYKYARVLRFGRLEDEAPFSSVRRLVEHEDYMLRLLRDSGVAVPEPIGVVEVDPGREYLLITELLPDAVEILSADGTDEVVDEALRQVRLLWAAGAAHRDVKPSNVLVQGGRVVLVDVSFGQLRPSRWRQAVDLADMLLILGLLVGPERTLARARAFFDSDELAEAFAAVGAVGVPRQLRRLLGTAERDLQAEFTARLPEHARIRVQRWSARRVALAVATVLGVVAAAALLWLNLRAGGLL